MRSQLSDECLAEPVEPLSVSSNGGRSTGRLLLPVHRPCEILLPSGEMVDHLCDIPGVERPMAWTLLAEIGADMSRFPTAGHLARWCGLCL